MDKKDKVRHYKQHAKELNEILIKWDPIGVLADDEEWPRDEYECFIDPILSALENHKGKDNLKEAIEKHLKEHFEIRNANGERITDEIYKWWVDKNHTNL